MEMDDAGDFKKARGILLTYSGIVLSLWFFGAKLDTFKLMGTEIKLEHHTNSVWLALASLNIYFFFRYVQHVPKDWFYFDDAMNGLYDSALTRFVCFIKRRALYSQAVHDFASKNSGPVDGVKIMSAKGTIVCHDQMREALEKQGECAELHQLSRESRTKMRLSVQYRYMNQGKIAPFWGHLSVAEHSPSLFVTWLVKGYTLVKGAFITPWFTNNIGPLLFGGISTFVALVQWWQMNHPG